MQRFNYNFRPLTSLAFTCAVVVIIGYFATPVPWWVVLGFCLWRAFCDFRPMARVTVGESTVTVVYLLPRAARCFQFAELAGFKVTAWKRRDREVPLLLWLCPRRGEPVVISTAGTQDLVGLSAALAERLPRLDENK